MALIAAHLNAEVNRVVVVEVLVYGHRNRRFIRDGGKGVWRWGGEGDSIHCHPQNDFCIKVGSDESHFNVS